MYLKKLGNDRRKSLGGRRKSRLFSSNELRGASEEEDEDVPGKKNYYHVVWYCYSS